jgi:hypothetical protein
VHWLKALLLWSRLSIDVSQVHLPANRTAALKHERLAAAFSSIIVDRMDLICWCQGLRTY